VALTYEQLERFWSKVDKTETCWLWTGWLKHNGYGMFDLGVIDGKKIKLQAHRVSYEVFVGPLIDGMTIDHIKEVCSSRTCVRPDHLRQITRGANVLAGDTIAARNKAKTHCDRGHEFTPENIYVPPKKPRSRYCRACMKVRSESRGSTSERRR
jgi:hypothetical protein